MRELQPIRSVNEERGREGGGGQGGGQGGGHKAGSGGVARLMVLQQGELGVLTRTLVDCWEMVGATT